MLQGKAHAVEKSVSSPSGGEGCYLQGFYDSLQSALGQVWLAATDEGLVYCSTPGGDGNKMHSWLRSKLPDVSWINGLNQHISHAKEQLSAYLSGQESRLDTTVCLVGTEFQRKVWQALSEIPYGQTRTYGQVAAQIGRPKGSRAVGQANNQNPLALFVP